MQKILFSLVFGKSINDIPHRHPPTIIGVQMLQPTVHLVVRSAEAAHNVERFVDMAKIIRHEHGQSNPDPLLEGQLFLLPPGKTPAIQRPVEEPDA